MQSLPPELELPEGRSLHAANRFSSSRIDTFWRTTTGSHGLDDDMRKGTLGSFDKEIARQMANILAPFRQ